LPLDGVNGEPGHVDTSGDPITICTMC